ncbi:OmpA family protein [Calditrichota bacterium]
MKNWIALSLIVTLLTFNLSYSQPSTAGRIGIGLKGGIATYYGDVADRAWKPHFGLSAYNWLSDQFALGIETGFTILEAGKGVNYFKNDLFYLGVGLKAKLFVKANAQPYLLAGIEGLRMTPKDINNNSLPVDSKFQFGFQLGAGLAVFLSDNYSLDLQGIYHPTLTDKLDGFAGTGGNDSYVTTALKFTIYFGGKRDSDGDGITDDKDECPKQAEDIDGFEDSDGCPDPDNDKDGIPDKIDKCPNKSEDIDGFQDKDGCPDPDNDGDGILDKKDKCPGTDETFAKKVDTKEDMDGWKDEDGCPDPDNDGDGIPDAKDKCPDKAETINGWEDQDGCPDVVPQVRLEVKKPIVLKGVYFITGSSKLDPNSEDILDGIVKTLKDNPQIEIEIRGHTDNTGSSDRNRKLSLERAESVKSYLVKNGITEKKIMTQGFGSDQPITTNSTVEGRARNRRIEFIRTK